ncbi:putative bifunctional diguanylate cyclase/phosphodiesterase [Roseibium denhamense]|uniref:PAS domain S-box-containing protein/diguanylate cyclase (GGDEF) domain-containing protein n=1 Tax=Roseibium denhamense TaxID=76305 RepID=A0ABY1PMP4_9HYPH|nr:EAL domain-containing protein [Roseibium denhamense]SMP36765.1 PAS domain S-box-containing protein/diguanylate cyclase (GGDEF) domain-containing protein [Roseibium denhamense]
MSLFAVGLIGTAVALFWVTYLGSLSIAEHEMARTARSKATLARLVFVQHLDQLERQIRSAATDPALRQALQDNQANDAQAVIDGAAQSMTSAVLDILLVDRPDTPEWATSSLGLIDTGEQLPPLVRAALPPDVWVLYTDHSVEPGITTAALSVLVLDPDTGQALGRVVGGTSVTDSFSLPGALAKTLRVDNLAFVHDDQIIAGLGDLDRGQLPEKIFETEDEVTYQLVNDQLFVKSPLSTDMDGHMISVVSRQTVDTQQNVRATYQKFFTPFLLYTSILALGAALIVSRITNTGLGRLLSYAKNLHKDRVVDAPEKGFISEFNQLASMFQSAFEAVRDRDRQFRDMIDSSLHGVLVHANHRIIYVNDALLEMLGYEPGQSDKLLDLPTLTVYAPEEHTRLRSYYKLREVGRAPQSYEVKGLRKDGQTIWLEQQVQVTEWRGELAYYATITDISDRKLHEELANKNANYDLLTGLPNRRLLIDRLNQTIQRNRQLDDISALMVLDVDRFKTVNETYGPKAGDAVIAKVAKRLTAALGPDQTVARMGGDEFAIILSNLNDSWHIETVAKDVLQAVAEPIAIEGLSPMVVSISIGITISPVDGEDDETLLLQADTSMYEAKADGGNTYKFFSARMNEQAARAGQIEISLRQAVENEALHLHYQPIVDYRSGSLVMCEALCRWTDPVLGPVPPNEFIKVAEESGLISRLGEWVIREACTYFASCNQNGHQLGGISVNLSTRQCRDTDFIDRLARILRETGMNPACLHLEITESMMFDDRRIDPVEVMESIRELGVNISLDDFGTGYSSLSYLKRLPIDMLKIDRSFIKGIEHDTAGQALVRAIVSMAEGLKIGIVCEGAETPEQCELITALGCNLIQGYGIARPMSAADFLRYLEEHRGPAKKIMGAV